MLWTKLATMLLAVLVLLPSGTYAAMQTSSWPSVLVLRWAFARDGAKVNAALEKHVPRGIADKVDIPYADDSPDAVLDIFTPADVDSGKRFPVIVWVHGGAFIGGSKNHVANYMRILAGRGYVTVSIDYSLAPKAIYPTPVLQLNEALAYVALHADEHHIDTTRIFLGGDSAGAQIASQAALAISETDYAKALGFRPAIAREQLRGLVLVSGAFAADGFSFEGRFRGFRWTVLRSYLGSEDVADDPRLGQLSIIANATKSFPAAFITSGNGDPLEPQARRLAAKLNRLGVQTDTLFFAKTHQPPLEHEYQFNLDIEEGKQALERAVAFLDSHRSP